MPDSPYSIPTPLLLGRLPIDGRSLASWEAFEVEASMASGVAVVQLGEHVAVPTLAAWARQNTGLAVVAVGVETPADEEHLLLHGVSEVLPPGSGKPEIEGAMRRARVRMSLSDQAVQFRTIVEQSSDIVIVVDEFGRFEYVSPSVTEHLGYTPEALVGSNAFDIVYKDDVSMVMGVFLEAIGLPDTVRSLYYRARAADGEILYIQGTGRAVIAPSGAPRAVIVARVLSEPPDTSTEVRASERRLRHFAGAATDAIVTADARGVVADWSEGAVALFGHSAQEAIGRSLSSLMPERYREAHLNGVQRFLETGEAKVIGRPLALHILRADGTECPVELSLTTWETDGERFFAGVIRDMTERVEAQQALEASEARYRSLLNALPDVISRIRRDGLVLDFHVPQVFRTEFPPSSLLGKNLVEEIPANLGKQFRDAVDQVQHEHELVTYRYEIPIAGDPHFREVRLVKHGPDEVISILRDVTAEVKAELALHQSKAELEMSQADLRALTSHLQEVREEERTHLSREVHDTLGQQLTAIRYAFGWFGRQLPDDEDAQRRLEDARSLIDETIQQVRKIAADLRPGVLDDFGLETALEWVAERTAERTGLRLSVVATGDASGVPNDVATAAFRIVQEALTNVARHAKASQVVIALDTSPEALRVRIQDDGVGLDANSLAARRSLGVLGMRERARALGGTLVLSGTPGEGATVSVSFPLLS